MEYPVAGMVFLWMSMVALYFLPTIIAFVRRHHNSGPIGILNLFLGWTLIGWVAALVWSLTSPPPHANGRQRGA